MPSVWILTDRCDGCGLCAKKCPYEAIAMRDGFPHILEHCTCCTVCLEVCKREALQTDIRPKEVPDFNAWKGIWVFAEPQDNTLHPVTLELLGKARDLDGQRSSQVSALLLGDRLEPLIQPLFQAGAQQIYCVQNPLLRQYATEPYTTALATLVGKHQPEILLIGATDTGRDLAPRLARRVGSGLTADCTELSIDPEEGILLQTRPAFGGNVMATIVNRFSRPQMATVRPGVMEPRPKEAVQGECIFETIAFSPRDSRVELLEAWTEQQERIDLNKARIIVTAGRGAASEEGLELLGKLAGSLGGELAGTRAMIEEKWLPEDRQIGQTGQTVRPELYIGCGVSGAVQHRAGMSGSRYVIAVNKDPRAPLLSLADWAIVGDLFQVVPELITLLSQRQRHS